MAVPTHEFIADVLDLIREEPAQRGQHWNYHAINNARTMMHRLWKMYAEKYQPVVELRYENEALQQKLASRDALLKRMRSDIDDHAPDLH